MNENGCEREIELAAALRAGDVSEELRDHARSCPDCAAAARLAVWMNRLAASGDAPVVPDPMIVRLKAQLLGQTPADQKILQPIHLLQRAAFALIALGWAGLLTWKWDAITGFSLDRMFIGAISGAALSPAVLASVAALGCATVIVTVHAALAGE